MTGTDGSQKIAEALAIIRALGLPRGQQNERSALTLLALVDLRPGGSWADLRRPLLVISPRGSKPEIGSIMGFGAEHYGREYAPNSRETFRRYTMHQFVAAGIALYNPDRPGRPVNSPQTCYQISPAVFALAQTWGRRLGIHPWPTTGGNGKRWRPAMRGNGRCGWFRRGWRKAQ